MMGREAVISNLLTWLDKGNEADRFYTVRALANLNATETSQQLIERLGDDDDDVCTEAALALGKLACKDAIPVLKQAISNHDLGDVRIAATKALSNIGTDDALDILLGLAQERPAGMEEYNLDGWDDYWDIQRIAIIGIGDHQVSKAVPVLTQLLKSESCQDLEPEILTALAKADLKGVEFLLSILAESSNRTIRRAVSALAQCKSEHYALCLNEIVKLISHQDAHVRLAACQTLGHFSLYEAFEPLAHCFADTDTDVAEAAILSVINIARSLPDGLKAISPHMLLSIAKEANDNACKALFKIAGEMSAYADEMTAADYKFLTQFITHSDEELMLLAAKLLFNKNNTSFQDIFIELISNKALSSHICRDLIQYYAIHIKNDEVTLAPIISLLNEKDNVVRTAALEVIAKTAKLPFDDEFNPAECCLYHLVINKELPTQATSMEALSTKEIKINNNIKAEQVIPVTVIETDTIENNDTIDNLMSEIKQDIGSQPEIELSEDTPVVTSTLAAIGATAINEAINPAAKEIDQDQRLRQLLEEQPKEMVEFNGIVEEHLQSGNKLGYSRKKNARIAIINNQVLAAQALAYYPVKSTVQLILESLRTPDIELNIALLTALNRIVENDLKIKGLSNIVGICSTLLFGGNEEIQYLAAKILGQLKHRQAIPALQDALASGDQNVRIQSIHALGELISKKAKHISAQQHVVRDENKDESRDEKSIRLVIACLDDPEYGVRKAAVIFIQNLKIPLIEKLVDTGCVDGGVLAGTVGKALKVIDTVKATKVILSRLSSSEEFSQRKYLFNQLEYLYGVSQFSTAQ